jgi:hypothetical protein
VTVDLGDYQWVRIDRPDGGAYLVGLPLVIPAGAQLVTRHVSPEELAAEVYGDEEGDGDA